MSKLRKKIIAVLAVLFCALLVLSAAFIIPKTEKPAKAAATTTLKNDIVNETTHLVNDSGLKELFTALSGSATYSAVENLFNSQNEYTAEALTTQNGGTEYYVKFGGKKWIPAYLSKSGGDIILTLWLADSSEQVKWSQHSTLSDTYDTSKYKYPSSMYSTSYIRAYLNGGTYSSAFNSSSLSTYNGTNDWVTFIKNYSSYIVAPERVSWQGTQMATSYPYESTNGNVCYPNEAYGELPDAKWKDGFYKSVLSHSLYSNWKVDKLWLASMTEITAGGMWKLSVTQRINGNAEKTALRTGGASGSYLTFYLKNDGTQTYTDVSPSYHVRPAFHFNITKAMELAPKDIETTYTGTEIKIATINNDAPDDIPWYNSSVYPDNVDDTYSDTVLNVGNYTAELSFKSTSTTGYRWASPDSPNGGTKTINIEVKEKPVSVVFNKGTSTDPFTVGSKVTSGVESEYPTVKYAENQLAKADEENGSRGTTHYPKLQIRYKNADPSTDFYDDTVKPTLPGKYYAIAEIDTEDAAENNKIINYKIITEGGADRISFEITPIKVKNPTLQNAGSLTYSGLEQTVNIDNKDGLADGLIKYTVTKKNGNVVTEKGGKELKDITADSFKIIDAGEYSVTFTFVDKDVKDTHVWKDSEKNDDYKLTFEVKKKALDFTLNSSSTDFANNVWKAQTVMPFTVNITGECGQEKVELVVTRTDKEGVNESVLDDSGNRSYSIPALDTGTKYKLYIKLSDADVNKNYEIKYNGSVTERIEKAFTITAAKVNFGDSNLVWVYENSKIDDGKEQSIASGDELTYNGEVFKVSLKRDELTQYGLTVDTDFAPPTGLDGELRAKDVGTYTVKVRIKAVSAEYEFETKVFTFEWKIKKATYDLSKITKLEWSYVARGDEMGEYPSGGIQYEGGDDMGPDGLIKIYVSGGLPDGLEVDVADIRYNEYYDIGSYVAEIQKLKNTYTTNYEDVGDISGYDWATFDWEIVKRILDSSAEFWAETVEYDVETCKVTKAPELKTAPYNPKLYYRYFESADCSGAALELKDLEYVEGKTKTYWVRAFIVDTDVENAKNWGVDPENKFEFKVGETKIAVELNVTAGGEYDGTPKGATLSIVGNVAGIDTNAFELTYYNKSNLNNALDGAPTHAGSYRVTIALKAGYSGYYIKSDKYFDFTIDTRKLTVPPEVKDNLTYDGTEQDVAAAAGLPDGWGNYISINIKSLTNGIAHPAGSTIKAVADYEVSFSIKEGINTGTPNNVEWNDGSKTPKKMKISIVRLVLHAEDWVEADYDSYVVFTENNGRNFVVYTVTDVDGKVVDKATVEASENESFTVTLTIAEEHNGNVEIVFADGISNKYEFFTSGALPPVKVKLPTIKDLTFNGENQTFTVDFGEFEEYIELDLSLSDVSALTQFNAGEYTVYFKIKGGQNAVWADTGDRKSIAVTFKMKVLVLEEPQVKSGERFTYSGSAQSATLNIDAAILARFMKIEGDYTATNAGDYTFTLSIDPSFAGNVVWASAAQGVDTVKTVDWTIEKARVSVKWTQSGDVPELDIPEEFKDLDVEYEIRDENGNVVSPDQMEAGKTYTVTAKLKEGSAANYEFVDDSGKSLSTATDGFGFEFKSGKSPFPWWIIAVAAGALLLILALIIIVVKKRQTADGDDEFDDYYGEDYDYDEEEEIDDFDDEDF